MKKENSISRRSFLKSSALAGALGAIGTGSTVGVLTSCGGGESANAIKPLKEPGTYYVPELPDLAVTCNKVAGRPVEWISNMEVDILF